ncbi:LppM family (lipo)protein [Actinomyces dentalis]|uniref:LppM family (lipo)protein n=1 Tax=Actinomyces dentalis TaxID=272548 RepID=UPI0003F73419|nr:hypothetical protein [Actinomyces dentalis]
MRLPSIPRRLVAVVPAVLMVLAGLGLAPTASATSSDDSLSYEFEIHENKTVDITMTQKGDDVGSKSNCSSDNIEDSLGDDVKVSVKSGDGGDSCTVTIKGLTLKKFNNNTPAEITHEDDSFTFEMSASSLQYYDQVTVKVTFPGKVSEVSGDGKKSGSTATWNNAQDETEDLKAEGADHGSPLFTILIVIVVIAAIGGGVAAFIIIRQKRAKTGTAPGYPQPGQQPYAPQPGYGQPGQAPGPGPAQPGYYAQPGAQQQPYNPQQGGTSGYNPGGQY